MCDFEPEDHLANVDEAIAEAQCFIVKHSSRVSLKKAAGADTAAEEHLLEVVAGILQHLLQFRQAAIEGNFFSPSVH